MKKGTDSLRESFSGFGDPNLETTLKKENITKVYVCGLAFDFCVGSTALDSAKLGFETIIIRDATKCIANESTEKMNELLLSNKVKLINSSEI